MPPSSAKQHAEWLSLIEVSGPFLSLGTLVDTFPDGLDAHDPDTARDLRRAHAEWEEEGARDPAIHNAWIDFVLGRVLDLPDEVRRRGQDVPFTLSVHHEAGETLRPDQVIVDSDAGTPRLLVSTYSPERDLDAPPTDGRSAASPIEQMEQLCAGTGVRLGLVTNGERWTLIDSVAGATTSRATWYATLWLEEQLTQRAFRSLLGVGRFFSVAEAETLEALLSRSGEDQQTVTDQLGTQVRRAVEMLVHALDLADRTRDRSLLREVPDQEVYEACLTVMMRLVVLLSAEERDLLLLGDDLWDDSYAIGTLRARLRAEADAHGEEILERRSDAWPRLLATFRAVYGGVSHGSLRLPAYGGNLLDPDRFPFLEGRPHGTDWRTSPANPLPVDNRTVLHLLDALQQLEVKVPGGKELRALSFRGLDVEQIGHVYEGLLDHTAFRTSEPAFALKGKKEPELALRLIEEQAERGWDELVAYIVEESGLSAKAVAKGLDAEPDDLGAQRLLVACEGDEELRERVLPYAGLIRADSFGYPLVFPEGSLFVTEDPRRRNTGTHYTPPSLTEPIVRYALEPVVYVGPAEGWEREKWRLKLPAELLDLKVADIAMGSGAFLVQACRYLAERLLEAWEANAPKAGGPRTSPEALPSSGSAAEELIPDDPAERRIYARRLIASRCLYGVDKDPMAVEMAKLSLWLVTLQKDRPFTFLDHALRSGDSLLGITTIAQLTDLNPDPGEAAGTLSMFAQPVLDAVERATVLRASIEGSAPLDATESEAKADLLRKAEAATADLQLVADLVVGADLGAKDYRATMAMLEVDVQLLLTKGDDVARTRLRLRSQELLDVDRPAFDADRRPFHWAIEFPEVFGTAARSGFNVVLGNPPFLGGKKLTGALGSLYREALVRRVAAQRRGSADLVAFFFLRAGGLCGPGAALGLIATNTIAEGDTREVGLDQLCESRWSLVRASTDREWPGVASLYVSHVWLVTGEWLSQRVWNDEAVSGISPSLRPMGKRVGPAYRLLANRGAAHIGAFINGGFDLSIENAAAMIEADSTNREVLFPYLIGRDLTTRPDQSPSRWVVDFRGRTLDEASRYALPMAHVREQVLPARSAVKRKAYRERWWLFAEPQEAMRDAIKNQARVLVGPQTTKHWSVTFVPAGWVLSHMTTVFSAGDSMHAATLSSSIHEAWAREQSGSLGVGLRYSPTDCFLNFPFPPPTTQMEEAIEQYLSHRASTLIAENQGLTTVYNRMHEDPDDQTAGIAELRRLRVELDRAVLSAYGWGDIDLAHGHRMTDAGVRFAIDPDARSEVLDRVFELNRGYHAAELGAEEGREIGGVRP